MATQRIRLIRRFPSRQKLITDLSAFCHQGPTGGHFSNDEWVELCNQLVAKPDPEANVFWADLESAQGDDAKTIHLLRKIVPKKRQQRERGTFGFLGRLFARG